VSKKSPQEHYVQQRYLKYFAGDDKKTTIYVFDKKKNEIRNDQPINRIACEGGFYDIDIDKIVCDHNEISQQVINIFLRN